MMRYITVEIYCLTEDFLKASGQHFIVSGCKRRSDFL